MISNSLAIKTDNLQRLKKLFPEVFSEGKIDFQRLKDAIGGDPFVKEEHFELYWAGKKEARLEIQKKTTATLVQDKKNSINFEKAQHVFIEGENLVALKLLQKSYIGKVKMIYIDPPYNTGNNSFAYHDDYTENKIEYNKRTGLKDEIEFLNEQNFWKKNLKESGQSHSAWLSMIYPRLYLGRNLLQDNGVIFISIDDNEQANLKMICDEVFGEQNFIGDIIWNSTKSVTNTSLISVSHNFNLVYAKNIDHFTKNRNEFRIPENGSGFANPDKDPRGAWKADPFQVGGWRPNQQYEIINPKTGKKYLPNPGNSWKNDKDKFQELIKENRIVFGSTGDAGPQRKRFLSEALLKGKVTKTWWDDVGTTTNGTQLLKKLFDNKVLFTNPKPVDLIKRMIQLGDFKKDGIILDFFAGSGTTAQAVLELNQEDGGKRKFICIQMPEPTDKNSEAYKSGYKTISEITKARISKVITKISKENSGKLQKKNSGTIGFKSFKLVGSKSKSETRK